MVSVGGQSRDVGLRRDFLSTCSLDAGDDAISKEIQYDISERTGVVGGCPYYIVRNLVGVLGEHREFP